MLLCAIQQVWKRKREINFIFLFFSSLILTCKVKIQIQIKRPNICPACYSKPSVNLSLSSLSVCLSVFCLVKGKTNLFSNLAISLWLFTKEQFCMFFIVSQNVTIQSVSVINQKCFQDFVLNNAILNFIETLLNLIAHWTFN